jgi:hypothetical protein
LAVRYREKFSVEAPDHLKLDIYMSNKLENTLGVQTEYNYKKKPVPSEKYSKI